MKLKKEYIFIIINYAILIICWAIFDSRIILMDNNILEIIGLINVLIHTLLMFGGEGVIYCIFATKNNFRLSIKRTTRWKILWNTFFVKKYGKQFKSDGKNS